MCGKRHVKSECETFVKHVEHNSNILHFGCRCSFKELYSFALCSCYRD